ncbi:unnamed protein product, partial [Ixodes pacificus]
MAEPQPPQPKQTFATAEAQPVVNPHDYPTNSNDTNHHADQRVSPDAAASMQPPSTQPTRPPSRAAARCKSAARTLAMPYSDSKRPRKPSASSTGTNLTDMSELLAADTMETEDEPQSQDCAGVESSDVVTTDYLDATQDASEDCSWQDVYYKNGKLRYGRSRCNETTPDTNTTAEPHREENDRFVVVFRSAERYNLATLPLENLVKSFYGALGLDRRNCEEEQKLLIRTGSTTNTVSVITKTRAQVTGLLKIKAIRAPDREVSVIAHELPPSNTTRGVIRGINPTYSPEQLMSELDCKSHEILFARKLGNNGLALVTFQGNRPPYTVLYMDRITRVAPYRPKTVVCRRCHGLGHKENVCTRRQRCPDCGCILKENHICERTYCVNCRSLTHIATDPKCPTKLQTDQKLQSRNQPRRSRNRSRTNQRGTPLQAERRQPPPKVTLDDYPPLAPSSNRFAALTPPAQPRSRSRSRSAAGKEVHSQDKPLRGRSRSRTQAIQRERSVSSGRREPGAHITPPPKGFYTSSELEVRSWKEELKVMEERNRANDKHLAKLLAEVETQRKKYDEEKKQTEARRAILLKRIQEADLAAKANRQTEQQNQKAPTASTNRPQPETNGQSPAAPPTPALQKIPSPKQPLAADYASLQQD